MSSKLHALLAVSNSLETEALQCLKDLRSTFERKPQHFTARTTQFLPDDENVSPSVEEQLTLQTTVTKELKWVSEFVEKLINCNTTIDVANTKASAQVEDEEGNVLLPPLPATALLQLEKTVRLFHDLCKSIPTLDPSKGFEPDPDEGEGVYRSREIEKIRTKKMDVPIVLYDATDKHPAQTQLVSRDERVGLIRTTEWSSMITPSEKSRLLTRCENLIRAIKKARSKANEVEVEKVEIGKKLFDYLLK